MIKKNADLTASDKDPPRPGYRTKAGANYSATGHGAREGVQIMVEPNRFVPLDVGLP